MYTQLDTVLTTNMVNFEALGTASAARIVIVGGAIMGSFTAWALRQAGFLGAITVVEKDPSYQFSSTALSAASIRTQFGTPANTQMSLYGADLFRHIKRVFGPAADIGFQEKGYLILGQHADVAARKAAAQMQRVQGADIDELTPSQIHARFPGMQLDDIGMATFGARHEGWFDAWS